MIELQDLSDDWHTVWIGTDVGNIDGTSEMEIRFPMTDYQVQAVRITTDNARGYGKIDAIRLITGETWDYTCDSGELIKQVNNYTGVTWNYGYEDGLLTHVEKHTTDGGTLELEADYGYDVYGNQTEFTIWTAEGSTHVERFSDHSKVQILDDGLELLDEIEYDNFGTVISRTDPEFDGRYKWSTRDRDTEINLLFNTPKYFDASTGRWIAINPLGVDAGDSILSRYVNNQPTASMGPGELFPIALQGDVKKNPDERFEEFLNLKDPRTKLTDVPEYLNQEDGGKTRDGAKINFKFTKAQQGDIVSLNKVYKGVYVKIQVDVDSKDFTNIYFIQVVQQFTKDGNNFIPAMPDVKERQLRADWSNPTAPSKGWYVDAKLGKNIAYYGSPGFDIDPGGRQSILRDAPGQEKGKGKRFITCAIGIDEMNNAVYLGCVRWGFYVNGDGAAMISGDGKKKGPAFSSDVPQELIDCLNRWNAIDNYRPVTDIRYIKLK